MFFKSPFQAVFQLINNPKVVSVMTVDKGDGDIIESWINNGVEPRKVMTFKQYQPSWSDMLKGINLDFSLASTSSGFSTPSSHFKPALTFTQLIQEALLSTEGRGMFLTDIYNYIEENYPFYKIGDSGWKVTDPLLVIVLDIIELY